ncbi:MAG: DUF1572 family protein [Flavobacteriales bacterium]|jgi:uncharacterized damage-inducible protein DinB|nr:DUF1572 family protein [Flavobacteriales bacterium]MCB0759693.1 DUF1572 family protein [Flavobacteriales bacterium]
MELHHLRTLFTRDLRQLCNEIDAFTNEADLWRTTGTITNSAGNLCMHICGNLRYFIGALLGGGAYVRDRNREFEARNILKAALLDEVNRTMSAVDAALAGMTSGKLKEHFPVNVLPEVTTTEHVLLHLYGHLNYHLGQVNYLRRALKA